MNHSEPSIDDATLDECEQRLGYRFRDRKLLHKALTHASSSPTRLRSYERLEFLGDSILGFLVCEYLFQKFPNWLEGELTTVKSAVVSRNSCARYARELGLEDFLLIGKGLEKFGSVPASLLANVFEALVAAIYLDGGWSSVNEFLKPVIIDGVDQTLNSQVALNYKSELQQLVQKRFGIPPQYQLIEANGPDHMKWFCMAAYIGKRHFTPAWGRNKKKAEQRAAANALAEIRGEDPPFGKPESWDEPDD